MLYVGCPDGAIERTENIYYGEGIQEYEARVNEHAKMDGKNGGVGNGWTFGRRAECGRETA